MISPDTIRANFVEALRSISSLVALLGNDADNIEEYVEEENGDLFATIRKLEPPKLLVAHQGTGLSGGQMSVWRHDFALILRPSSSAGAIFAEIVNGIPSGSSLPMLNHPVHAKYHQMAVPTSLRRSIPVTEATSFDYWEILTNFTSKGFD
jgi:hypothetical protein